MRALLLYALVLACSQPKEHTPAPVCPPAPKCSASVVYIDLEAERIKQDYDFRTGKKRSKAVCMGWGAHWMSLNQMEWCEAKATEFDCGYDSWMDAWPGGKPWSAEGNFKTIGACCFDDPESKFDCAYMKERARVCDELIGQTHKVTCHTVFCEDKRKICL